MTDKPPLTPHLPVMLADVLAILSPKNGDIYVDGTFGYGGYTRAFLESADCTVIAIDRDPTAKQRADAMRAEFGNRLVFVHGRFGDALEIVKNAGFDQIDGFVLDVGVSSMQIDDPSRGFSFRFDGPLDMRMNPQVGQSAADLVNTLDEGALADILYHYGDERKSRAIARKIIAERRHAPIETTSALVNIIQSVIRPSHKDKSHPATRSFQALRIAVNDELNELSSGLLAAEKLLKVGGRLVVVSFHSLEDGIVKSFLYERAGKKAAPSRFLPVAAQAAEPSFILSPKKPVDPSTAEISQNPRARSARLRSAIRTHAPCFDGRRA